MESFEMVWAKAKQIEIQGVTKIDANIWFEKGRRSALERVTERLEEAIKGDD